MQGGEYRLTEGARKTAAYLVRMWNDDVIAQTFELVDATAGSGVRSRQYLPGLGADDSFEVPAIGELNELARLNLISIRRLVGRSEKLEITLFQPLRDAVDNDFTYFRELPLTGAIGTIIYGNLTMGEGAVFSSAGQGDVTVTFQTLPDELLRLLGTDALRPEIASAITDLKNADEPTRLRKAGKVIEELGRGLEHLSNTGGALAAIALIARMLSGGGL